MNIHADVTDLINARKLLNMGLTPVMDKLKDQTIDLADRWIAYTKLVENNILEDDIYGDGYIDILGNLTLYDNFHVDRHQTMSFPDMYEHIMEADGEYQKELVEARDKNLSQWQEKVLASGYASFTYDW